MKIWDALLYGVRRLAAAFTKGACRCKWLCVPMLTGQGKDTSPRKIAKIIAMQLTLIGWFIFYVGIGLAVFLKCECLKGTGGEQHAVSVVEFFYILAIVMVVVGTICVLANISWALMWRFFASKGEITYFTKNSSLTRFEKWLIDVMGPQL